MVWLWSSARLDRACKGPKQFLLGPAKEFPVSDAGATNSISKASSKLTSTGKGKGQPKGQQPAKYRDPKTGASWSGRGRAPAWLASVKDWTRYLIVDDTRRPNTVETGSSGKGKTGRSSATKRGGTKLKSSEKSARASAAVKKSVAVRKTMARKIAEHSVHSSVNG